MLLAICSVFLSLSCQYFLFGLVFVRLFFFLLGYFSFSYQSLRSFDLLSKPDLCLSYELQIFSPQFSCLTFEFIYSTF